VDLSDWVGVGLGGNCDCRWGIVMLLCWGGGGVGGELGWGGGCCGAHCGGGGGVGWFLAFKFINPENVNSNIYGNAAKMLFLFFTKPDLKILVTNRESIRISAR